MVLIAAYRVWANSYDNHFDPSEDNWQAQGKEDQGIRNQNFFHGFFKSAGTHRRREYYRNFYLKSDVWERYVVLKRDNRRCVYCLAKATQVHHKRYACVNIGREAIDWLMSVCKPSHDAQHK